MRVTVCQIFKRIGSLAPELTQWSTFVTALAALALAVLNTTAKGIHDGTVISKFHLLGFRQVPAV